MFAFFFLLGYIFTVGLIRYSLTKLPDLRGVKWCVRLPNGFKKFLFLPLPFSKEVHVFPVHTVVLTSLVHVAAIATIITVAIATSIQFTLPEWAGAIMRGAVVTWLVACILELLLLGSDEASQKPPKL